MEPCQKVGCLSTAGLSELQVELQDPRCVAGWSDQFTYRWGQPRLHVLGHFPSHMLGRLFLLELSALLSSAISGQTVKVHVVGFELLHQLCHKDSCTDVVKG